MDLNQTFIERWRSGKHVGAAKPSLTVGVRRGSFIRARQYFTFLDGSTDDFADLPGSNLVPWFPKWSPDGEYAALPNVSEVSEQQSFDNNGFMSYTIQLENVVYKSIAGVLGTYHAVARGELSPYIGFVNLGRIQQQWNQVNAWLPFLKGASQLTIWQGYGDEITKVFTGLIDQVDMTSNPDHMTITCRDFGASMLGEQRLFGWNKDPKLKPPVRFVDRQSADQVVAVSGGAKASTEDTEASHPARNVTKKGSSFWLSHGRGGPNVTEWVQIRVKRGRYESIYISPHYAGMDAYISVYGHSRKYAKGRTEPPQADNVPFGPGWYDAGIGTVPGAAGGIPYIKKLSNLPQIGKHFKLPISFEVGDNSIVRISFRNLGFSHSRRDYRAGCDRLIAYWRKRKPEARNNRWILVDDASDVVRVVLRWAGFREWEVENFGVRIPKDQPWIFHQSDFLIDLVNYVKSQGDYTFHMGRPTDHNLSTGVPIFRSTHAVAAPNEVFEVTDHDLLTGISASIKHPTKAHIIRSRGRIPKKGQRGSRLGEDKTKRVSASYTPPWARAGDNAGVVRHITNMDPFLETELDCKVACILIAVQQALQSNTGEIEIPGMPGIGLDEQISILDQGTGINSRLWIASRSSTFTTGPDARWTTRLGGSLLDTPDLLNLLVDFLTYMNQQRSERESKNTSRTTDAPGFGSAHGIDA